MKPELTAPHAGAEETLDPADWTAIRALGHRMVDDMMDSLATARERPVWRPVPDGVKSALSTPIPLDPQGADAAYADFKRDVLPYPLGNTHPRFWGWVLGTGTPLGALSDMLAAGMNASVFGAEQSPGYVELQVLHWLKDMLGFPLQSSGLLVSGGSMATLVGLAAARNAKAEPGVLRAGLTAASRPMTLYASSQTHSCVPKAASLLGLGRDSVRSIAVDSDFRIDLDDLRRTLAADRQAGRHPFCVVGNAGTVNTGAFDDISALADLCAAEGLWFHVDGAFGALAAISPRLRPLTAGMDRADSLAFDLHKWMYMPYDVGCALVRDSNAHRAAFDLAAEYLTKDRTGLAAGPTWLSDYGVQLSRGFRALKVWMSLKEHGLRKYSRLIEQNCDQAAHLARLVRNHPDLELLAPVPLNVVCFRFRSNNLSDAQLDELNAKVLLEVQESGLAAPSSTRIRARFAIRVAISNHRTRRPDLDLLVHEVTQRGQRLASGVVPRTAPAST